MKFFPNIKRFPVSILMYLGIFLIAFSLFVYIGSIFTVKSFRIEGTDDVKGLDAYSHSLLFMLNEESMTEYLSEQNPVLTSIDVYKEYPDTVLIHVQKLRPAVSLLLSDGSILLSHDGTVLSKQRSNDTSGVPFINHYQPFYYNQFVIGEVVDEADIIASATFTDSLLDLGIAVTSIDITNDNMILLHTDEFSVLITTEKETSEQFDEFSITYKQLKLSGQEFNLIDVRFEKPIIKLE